MLRCPTIKVNDNMAQKVTFASIDFRSQNRGYRFDGFAVRFDQGAKSANAVRV
jgi:hypothetical protein